MNDIIIFFFSTGYILKRVGHMNVFSIVFFVYATIFFLFSIIENPVYVLPVEILSGVAFALIYCGAISYADLSTPAGAEGTFQGVVGTALMGIGSSYNYCGRLMSHQLYQGYSNCASGVKIDVGHV